VSDTSAADQLFVSTRGTDTSLVVRGNSGPLILSLQFNDLAGTASNGQALDQDPSRYPILTGAATGPDGQIYFELAPAGGGGGGHTKDPKASCHAARLTAAATLCQAKFECLAKRAKAPQKDPQSDVLHACTAKADTRFLTAFGKAGDAAARKGLQCPLSVSGDVARQVVTNLVAFSQAWVDSVTPATPALGGAWLGGAATACGAGLKAEAKHASKPDAPKLATARQKADDKLTAAAAKAVDKAEHKGVVFDPDPPVASFVDSVDDAIDGASSALGDD
jgi:hypothetical protein